MAYLRRGEHHSSRRSIAVALAGGIAVGLLLAVIHLSASPSGIFSSAIQRDVLLQTSDLDEKVVTLQQQLKEIKKERDAARAQIADQLQKQRDLEAKLLSSSTTTTSQKQQCAPDRHAPWFPSPERDLADPELAAVLRKTAINDEVLVAVSNKNYAWPGGMLELWMKCVKNAGVKNVMVVALDDFTKKNSEKNGIGAFRIDMEIPEGQKSSGGNHAVSALKFRILERFMNLGYSVLLSDVDIITISNPFDILHRDVDVESMSDGWDDATAYGYNDVAEDASMGWARFAHSMRIFVFNSGLFYLRPTQATMDLINKTATRLETIGGWDQAVFNEGIFFPNSPNNKDPAVTRRTVDYLKFINSKTLFKFLRHDKARMEQVKPSMIHVNYHPNKFERMQAIYKYYYEGDKQALDQFPDGSE